MGRRSTEAAARAIRTAPADLMESSEVWGSWSVQHKKHPGKEHWVTEPPKGDPAWWFTSWAGDRHRLDDPEEAKRYEMEAHKIMDVTYRGDDTWADHRLLLRTETHTVKVERVPVMWEV